MNKKLLTVPEAAGVLSIGRSTLYQLIGEGRIAVVRVGRATRVPASEIDRFIEEHTIGGDR